MRRLVLLAGALSATTMISGHAMAADAYGAWKDGLPTAWVEGPVCDPLVDYNCNPAKI